MKFALGFIFCILLFKHNNADAPYYTNRWVVWNVGQGQWVTHILTDSCHHFDMGGEFGSFKTIKKPLIHSCGKKQNTLNLSHWDYDHFLNVPAFARAFPHFCWQTLPEFGYRKKTAQEVLKLNIPNCSQPAERLLYWVPLIVRNTNDASIIFSEENVLLAGDSPIQQEKIWAFELNNIASTRVLLLGHHGSRTSTGKQLLSQLPQLKFTISSARFAKYRHPHPETLARLSEFNIPLLKTEDWGNIWFD